MSWIPFFKKKSNECLGIDIGTSSIKVVKVSKRGKEKKLENYGEIKVNDIYPDFKKKIISASSEELASFLRAILDEAGIDSDSAVIAIPDYSTFFTNFILPSMNEDEVSEAVKFEAPVHIPLPLSKVSLDWQIVNGDNKKKKDEPIKILAVAVPNEVVNKYKEIAFMAGLELESLEAEVFGLIRSSVKDEDVVALVDIGKESTSFSIVEGKSLKISHSFDAGGEEMTKSLMKGMDIEYREAEEIKIKDGILENKKSREHLLPVVDKILKEVEDGRNNFFKTTGVKTRKIILSGGPAFLPGIKEYFFEKTGMKIEIADPFSELICPDQLKSKLKKMGPFYAVSVGVALGGIK
jgi:type IV pilus assembly protein PilM